MPADVEQIAIDLKSSTFLEPAIHAKYPTVAAIANGEIK